MPTRYLKPGICDSDALDKCSPLTETLFYRLLVNVDDYGRIDARPAVIRAKCWPLKDSITNADTLKALIELQSNGLILMYESNGCAYLQMQKWDNVPRSKESKCPEFSADCIHMYSDADAPRTVLPVTVTVTVTGTGTVTVNRKPETGTETGNGKPKPADYSDEFEEVWSAYPSRPGANKKDSFKAWAARLKSGVPASLILDGVRRYAVYCKMQQTDPQFIKQPATFLGPGEHYKSDWTATTRQPTPNDARMSTLLQIFPGAQNGTHGQTRDITPERQIESNRAGVPKIGTEVRQPVVLEMARDGDG